MRIRILALVMGLAAASLMGIWHEDSAQGKQWKGKMEYEKGIKVVRNPREPLYGEIKFELEEDLSIGKENDKNYVFFGRVILALDTQENIYALDGRNCRIQKFDKQGRYLQTIGRKGQGPGEFELPFKFMLNDENNIYVLDGRSLDIFNENGEFIKTVKLAALMLDFYVNPEGNIFASSELRDEKGSTQAIIKMDSGGKIVRKIAEFPYVELVVRKSGDVTYSFGISRHVYIPELCFAVINGRSFCYAHSGEYRIFIMDKDGNVSAIFQKEESPGSISLQEKNFILNQMKKAHEERGRKIPNEVWEEVQFPAHRPFFDHIKADDKQRLYVRRLRSVLDESNEAEFDIFSQEGVYLYKTRLPFTPVAIRNGFIYKVDVNEESGEIKIKKLKVRNWEQIKEGI